MLGILVCLDNLNGEPMLSNGGKHINPAGLQSRTRFFRMTASLVESAGSTKPAGSCPQAKGLMIACEKDFPLHFGSDFLCIYAPALEKDSLFI